MSTLTVNLYECKHCEGCGTCRNGKEGSTCLACIKRNELRGINHFGLLCGSCGGIGKAEPLTERMNKRIAPILASILIVSLLVIVAFASAMRSSHFNELLAFSSAIIGSLIGFYFSHQKS